MKLVKYESPASAIDNLLSRMNWGLPMLDRYFGDINAEEDVWSAARLPRTNIKETADSYVFSMEMPGLTKDDITVNLEGDALIVKGEKSEKHEEEGMIRREFRTTRFERTFNVGGVDRDKVKARVENGILVVTLPKVPEKVGRKIEIA